MAGSSSAHQVEELKLKALRELESIPDTKSLEEWRISYLGRRGQITQVLRGLGSLPEDQRREAGAAANSARQDLEEGFQNRERRLAERAADPAGTAIDVTLPGWPQARRPRGRIDNPMTGRGLRARGRHRARQTPGAP